MLLLVCSSRPSGVFVHKFMLDLHISKLYVRTAGSGRHNGAFIAASEFTDAEKKKKKKLQPKRTGRKCLVILAASVQGLPVRSLDGPNR